MGKKGLNNRSGVKAMLKSGMSMKRILGIELNAATDERKVSRPGVKKKVRR